MQPLKNFFYIIFIVLSTLSVFALSLAILGSGPLAIAAGRLIAAAVIVLIVSMGGLLYIFIVDRRKNLVFPALYIAGIILGFAAGCVI